MLGYNELLTETCSYEKSTSINKYNEKTYDTPINVKCFTSYNLENARDLIEQSIAVNKTVFVDNSFTPNQFDKIDGFEIKRISPVKGLKTDVVGWEIVV